MSTADSFEEKIESILTKLENSQTLPKQKYTLRNSKTGSILHLGLSSVSRDHYARVGTGGVPFIYMSKEEFHEFITSVKSVIQCDCWSIKIGNYGMNIEGLHLDTNEYVYALPTDSGYDLQKKDATLLDFEECSVFTNIDPSEEQLQLIYSLEDSTGFTAHMYIFENAVILVESDDTIHQNVFCIPDISIALRNLQELAESPVEEEVLYTSNSDIKSRVFSYLV